MTKENFKFDFYEKVTVQTNDPEKQEIDGKLAAIMGRSQSEEGNNFYSVHIYGEEESWYVKESELEPTGEFDTKDSFYDGSSIKVKVDKNSEGHIVDKDIKDN